MSKKIFLTGASGYIGGTLLTSILKCSNKYEIFVLVRGRGQVDTFKALGVTPVVGDLDDEQLLSSWAKKVDAVIHTASIYHMKSAQALVKGLQSKNLKRAVYIHTSAATGLYNRTEPIDDHDLETVRNVPKTTPHNEIDDWIYANCQDITAAIIAPTTVNGIGSGPFRKTSYQVPSLAVAAVARKQAGWVGARRDVIWGDVNVQDLADLYILVLEGLLANKIETTNEGGWYFASAEEHSWYHVAKALGQTLYKLGLVNTLEVSQFDEEYVEKYLGGECDRNLYEGDARCVASRAKKIGWRNRNPNVFETLEEEVKYLVDNGVLQKS